MLWILPTVFFFRITSPLYTSPITITSSPPLTTDHRPCPPTGHHATHTERQTTDISHRHHSAVEITVLVDHSYRPPALIGTPSHLLNIPTSILPTCHVGPPTDPPVERLTQVPALRRDSRLAGEPVYFPKMRCCVPTSPLPISENVVLGGGGACRPCTIRFGLPAGVLEKVAFRPLKCLECCGGT